MTVFFDLRLGLFGEKIISLVFFYMFICFQKLFYVLFSFFSCLCGCCCFHNSSFVTGGRGVGENRGQEFAVVAAKQIGSESKQRVVVAIIAIIIFIFRYIFNMFAAWIGAVLQTFVRLFGGLFGGVIEFNNGYVHANSFPCRSGTTDGHCNGFNGLLWVVLSAAIVVIVASGNGFKDVLSPASVSTIIADEIIFDINMIDENRQASNDRDILKLGKSQYWCDICELLAYCVPLPSEIEVYVQIICSRPVQNPKLKSKQYRNSDAKWKNDSESGRSHIYILIILMIKVISMNTILLNKQYHRCKKLCCK